MAVFLSGTLGRLSLLFGSWAMITGALWQLFDRVDKVASPAGRTLTTAWLTKADVGRPVGRFASIFANALNSVFGEHHFTWKCFGQSVIASFVWSATLFLVWGSIHPRDVQLKSDSLESYLLWWLVFTLIFNTIPDYLCLLKTRLIIGLCRQIKSRTLTLALIGGDALLAGGLSVLVMFVGDIVLNLSTGNFRGFVEPWSDIRHLIPDMIYLRSQDVIVAKVPSLGVC